MCTVYLLRMNDEIGSRTPHHENQTAWKQVRKHRVTETIESEATAQQGAPLRK